MSTRKEISQFWTGFEAGAKQGYDKTWTDQKWVNIKRAIHNLRDHDLAKATPEQPTVIIHMGNYFKVPSASKPGEYHTVDLNGQCSCKGYEVRKTCRHSELIKDLGKGSKDPAQSGKEKQ